MTYTITKAKTYRSKNHSQSSFKDKSNNTTLKRSKENSSSANQRLPQTPSETIDTSYDVLAILDHKHLHNQTSYLVTQWSPEILTQEQIDTCAKEEFTSKHIHPLDHTEGRPLYDTEGRLDSLTPQSWTAKADPLH